MVSRDPVIVIHSVAEAYLYFMVSVCRSCRGGPVRPEGSLVKTADADAPWRMSGRCAACDRVEPFVFQIEPPPTREQARSSVVNPTHDRSRAIDLLGWLTLFQSIMTAADQQQDKAAARQLCHEAGMCLDEALKFYGPAEDLPGSDAFFSESSRRQFVAHPARFERSTWQQRRDMLPPARGDAERREPRRRWYQFWRR